MSESRETIEDKSFKTKWKSLLWDTLDKGPVERRFLLKLDIAMLGFGGLGTWLLQGILPTLTIHSKLLRLSFHVLGFFTKFLDSANLTNAFVSGMYETRLALYPTRLAGLISFIGKKISVCMETN